MRNYLQKLGRSIMLPVAVLPAAALLVGIGYWIDSGAMSGDGNAIAIFLIQAGLAIIGKLPILFAVGIATGLSKDKHGASALSGLVAFLVVTTILSPGVLAQLQGIDVTAVDPSFAKIDNAFVGIICGVIAAELYNKFSETELPMALAFFSGKRLIPILSALVILGVAGVLFIVWPIVYGLLVDFGKWMVGLGPVGAGLFGFFNRMLIPTGLHHALNSVFWFDVAGINDIGNFLSGTGVKGVTGMYQAGFFPIMMFGLPGAALAMYRNAKPEKKKLTASIMIAGAVASFFTGITEPLEFAFMFVAPVLYLVHAALTGLSMLITSLLHYTAGFAFSAGMVDYLLSFKMPIANQPIMLVVIGIAMAVIYYFLFSFLIKKFNILTPGREKDEESEFGNENVTIKKDKYDIPELIEGLGGRENIVSTDHCVTRLRLELKDTSIIDQAKIKKIGALGIKIIDTQHMHIIIGTTVQFVYDALNKEL